MRSIAELEIDLSHYIDSLDTENPSPSVCTFLVEQFFTRIRHDGVCRYGLAGDYWTTEEALQLYNACMQGVAVDERLNTTEIWDYIAEIEHRIGCGDLEHYSAGVHDDDA